MSVSFCSRTILSESTAGFEPFPLISLKWGSPNKFRHPDINLFKSIFYTVISIGPISDDSFSCPSKLRFVVLYPTYLGFKIHKEFTNWRLKDYIYLQIYKFLSKSVRK